MPAFQTVLCASGLAAEAKIARAAGFSVVVGGGDRARTAALVADAARGKNCIVSFGIAGALVPELRAGDVIFSTEIVSADQSWRAQEPLRRRVAELARGVGALQGPVLGAVAILATPADKRRARAQTGALAVDLESDIVARIAAAAGIPFAAVRAIADTVDRELPPAALIPLAEDGTPDLARIVASLLRRPSQFIALVGLARETRRALSALAGPARALHGLVAAA